jgi:Secretion system C-terminal sorting domain
MKKYIILIITIFVFGAGFSQPVLRASLGIGDAPNQIKCYVKPNGTSLLFSSLQFDIALPVSVAGNGPVFPTLTLATTGVVSVIPAATWALPTAGLAAPNGPFVEAGFVHYIVAMNPGATVLTTVPNQEFVALQVAFLTGNSTVFGTFADAARLISLPDGGNTFSALYYASTSLGEDSNGQSLYYARDASVVVANGDTYRPVPIDPRNTVLGTFTSFARYTGGIVIPVKFTGFNVVKKDNDALLTWFVENESAATDRYEIERSVNGTDFGKIATVQAKVNGGTNSYNLTDFNLTSFKSSGVIYYRIKQIDKDGKFIYSETRTVRLDSKGFALNVYPNPAKDIVNVTLDLETASTVIIRVSDAIGKEVQKIQLQGNKGINIQKIDLNKFAAGSYMITVTAGQEIRTVPVVKTN